jgi:hypothetical protein
MVRLDAIRAGAGPRAHDEGRRDARRPVGREGVSDVRLGASRAVAELGIHQHDAETIMRELEEIERFQRGPSLGRR